VRILHTTSTYSPFLGGIAEIVRNISERLAHRGHEVFVATTSIPERPSHTVIGGVRVVSFDVRGNGALGMAGEVEKYRRFVQSGPWDIVVHHAATEWHMDVILGDIGAYPWPSGVVTHGLAAIDIPAYRSYFEKLPEFLRRYALWICTSTLGEEIPFAKQHGLERPHVITNGVDPREWSSQPVGVRQRWGIGDAPWIVNVSNHYGDHHKNHTMFFDVARRLKDTGVCATVIGNSHRAAGWNLGALGIQGGCFYACLARTLLSESVDLRRHVSREQVVSAIQEADLLVSTSRWEANSLVLIESMAAGTAWVSTDVGSARELTGGVVVGSSEEMAEAIRILLRDRDRRRSLGDAGRSRVKERHSWDAITSQYESLYQEVTSNYRTNLSSVVAVGS
jgi:glycosyltransferase involved in cell wall biosynthesis